MIRTQSFPANWQVGNTLGRDIDQVIAVKSEEVATDGCDVIGLGRVGKGVVLGERDTHC